MSVSPGNAAGVIVGRKPALLFVQSCGKMAQAISTSLQVDDHGCPSWPLSRLSAKLKLMTPRNKSSNTKKKQRQLHCTDSGVLYAG
mmetsp:Transcript_9710/g.17070  ORF Transcript_9710/g.17070 Transcript_9710/m.17070 type:complete len:86 (-) Transcript_9710:4-261(-)